MHEAAIIRKQGALGITVAVLHATADACDAGGARLSAARLMYAAGAVRGSAAGAEMRRTWESLRCLEQEGGGHIAVERAGGCGAQRAGDCY